MFGGHSNIEQEKSPTPAKPGRKFFEKSDLGYASFFRNERLVFRGANISFCGLYEHVNTAPPNKSATIRHSIFIYLLIFECTIFFIA